MNRLNEAFVRLEDGAWLCRAPIYFSGPGGRAEATPGVVYRKGRPVMGLDIGAALEAWHQTGKLPPNIVAR